MTRLFRHTAAFVPLRKKAAVVSSPKRAKQAIGGGTLSGLRSARRGERRRKPWRKTQSRRRRRVTGFPGTAAPYRRKTSREEPADIRDLAAESREETAYAKGYDEGYRTGAAAGAEEEVASLLPPYTILPDVSAKEVMQAGLQGYLHRLKPLMKPEEVYRRLEQSLAAGQPLSVVRLGDGELLALAHDAVLPLEQSLAAGPFLPTAGITLPDHDARERLVEAVRGADVIGIPTSRLPTYQGLLFPILRHFGISHETLDFTVSTINYALHEQKLLQQLLRGRQVLVIGNKAVPLANVLSASGVHVAGAIAPVNGFGDISRVLAEAASHAFDIALVAGGIPAVVICRNIAAELGKVALDFGHLADKLISGELTYD
ncbi:MULTISPECIES: GT-D fold domain-containing protein [Paenibacillus]|uniref:GT-D fold domain-containing protein n=1 Tax=Paenibacillus TaxID=44249 RepID=UPI001F436181|nr:MULTISPECIES: GT-D fold domain-containing glycosyltransferase [Paenibacillus]